LLPFDSESKPGPPGSGLPVLMCALNSSTVAAGAVYAAIIAISYSCLPQVGALLASFNALVRAATHVFESCAYTTSHVHFLLSELSADLRNS